MSDNDSFFTYTHSDGIHHITALQGTRTAVEAILEHVGTLFVGVPMTERVRILLDFHQVSTPLTQWIPILLAFLRRDGPETGHPSRVAYLYSRGARGTVLNAFLSVQRFLPQPITLRFFPEAEEAQAREWLQVG